MGPIFVTTHRTHPGGMITTPVGPTFMQNDGRSGAKSGDHTQAIMAQTGHRSPATVYVYLRRAAPLEDNAVTDMGL